MRFSESVKPISYLKANTSKVTHNGEAKMVVQGVRDYKVVGKTVHAVAVLMLSQNLRVLSRRDSLGGVLVASFFPFLIWGMSEMTTLDSDQNSVHIQVNGQKEQE